MVEVEATVHVVPNNVKPLFDTALGLTVSNNERMTVWMCRVYARCSQHGAGRDHGGCSIQPLRAE